MLVTRPGGSRVNWKIEHSPFTGEFGFGSFRILQEREQLTMLQEKSPHCCGLFALPASVSASAEAEGYTRAAITITAIVRPRSVAVASIVPRSVTVASIIRSVVTIAVMVVTTPVSMARADVG